MFIFGSYNFVLVVKLNGRTCRLQPLMSQQGFVVQRDNDWHAGYAGRTATGISVEHDGAAVEDASWLWKEEDTQHINLAKLDAVLKGVNDYTASSHWLCVCRCNIVAFHISGMFTPFSTASNSAKFMCCVSLSFHNQLASSTALLHGNGTSSSDNSSTEVSSIAYVLFTSRSPHALLMLTIFALQVESSLRTPLGSSEAAVCEFCLSISRGF